MGAYPTVCQPSECKARPNCPGYTAIWKKTVRALQNVRKKKSQETKSHSEKEWAEATSRDGSQTMPSTRGSKQKSNQAPKCILSAQQRKNNGNKIRSQNERPAHLVVSVETLESTFWCRGACVCVCVFFHRSFSMGKSSRASRIVSVDFRPSNEGLYQCRALCRQRYLKKVKRSSESAMD